MNDNEIKQLLENLEVQPSARCWESIDGALGAAGSASAAATKAAAQATRHLSAAAVKGIIAGSAATFIAAGALVTALLLSHPDEPATTLASTTTETSATAPQSDATALLPDTSATTLSPTLPQHSSTIPHENTTENTLTEAPATSATTETPTPTETATAPVVATTRSTTAPAVSSQQPNTQSTTKTIPKPAPKSNAPSTQPVSTPQPIPQTEDPVLAGRDDIDFSQPISIEIPNVITPNGDGYNDQFIIKGIENCEKSKLIIRSKSGAIVLQVNNYPNNWDAQNVPDGTYFYQFYYTIHGIEEIRSGTLTIIR